MLKNFNLKKSSSSKCFAVWFLDICLLHTKILAKLGSQMFVNINIYYETDAFGKLK